MTEVAKRLAPQAETLRELFLKSGNLCAYPSCGRLMMNDEGKFIGQLCHIEAAEEGGERFNPQMTNEERRAAANLMMMCYEHHTVTSDVERYTVDVLRRYKREHESRFSRADRAILESLTDWTRLAEPTTVSTLKRISDVLQWRVGEDDLQESIRKLNAYTGRLAFVPVDVRRFLGAVAMRMCRMENTNAVKSGGLGDEEILASDLRGAFGWSDSTIIERANEMEAYHLGSIDQMYQSERFLPSVRINRIDGWPFWLELAQFCERAPENMDAFTVDLDFRRLDG
jgi:hypothetical protein